MGTYTCLRPVGRDTGASHPKGNRPVAGGQVHRRFAPEKKPACGRWAGTRALRALKETGLRPVSRYTGASRPKGNRPAAGGRYTGTSRPKGNRPAAGGQVHGRFAPERKPACGRWQVHGHFAPERKPACGRWAGTRALRARKETGLRPVAGTRALRARKETGLRPVGRYTGASRPEGNRPAAG